MLLFLQLTTQFLVPRLVANEGCQSFVTRDVMREICHFWTLLKKFCHGNMLH